jgi:hypothetical protein
VIGCHLMSKIADRGEPAFLFGQLPEGHLGIAADRQLVDE